MYGLRSVLAPVATHGTALPVSRHAPARHSMAAKSAASKVARAGDVAA